MPSDHRDILRHDAIALLECYSDQYPHEKASAEAFRHVLHNLADPFLRTEIAGHVTVSVVAITRCPNRVLMIHHPILNRWLQPGGHIETATDVSIMAAAVRECFEETGLKPIVPENGPLLLDLDVHRIPPSSNMPSHLHYDMRMLCLLQLQKPITPNVRLTSLAKLTKGTDRTLARFAEKIVPLLPYV